MLLWSLTNHGSDEIGSDKPLHRNLILIISSIYSKWVTEVDAIQSDPGFVDASLFL